MDGDEVEVDENRKLWLYCDIPNELIFYLLSGLSLLGANPINSYQTHKHVTWKGRTTKGKVKLKDPIKVHDVSN